MANDSISAVTFILICVILLPLLAAAGVRDELRRNNMNADALTVYQKAFARFWVGFVTDIISEVISTLQEKKSQKKQKKQNEQLSNKVNSALSFLSAELNSVVSKDSLFTNLFHSVIVDYSTNTFYVVYLTDVSDSFDSFRTRVLNYSQLYPKEDSDFVIVAIDTPFLFKGDGAYKGMYMSRIHFKTAKSFQDERLTHAKVDEALTKEVDSVESVLK